MRNYGSTGSERGDPGRQKIIKYFFRKLLLTIPVIRIKRQEKWEGGGDLVCYLDLQPKSVKNVGVGKLWRGGGLSMLSTLSKGYYCIQWD